VNLDKANSSELFSSETIHCRNWRNVTPHYMLQSPMSIQLTSWLG